MEPERASRAEAPYDGLARFYNENLGQYSVRILPVLEKLILGHIPPGGRVLDLCCGTGQLARSLYDRGYSVVGVDESSEMLRFARLNAPGVEFIQANAVAFTLAGTVDGVVSVFDSINHLLSLADLKQVFSCVYRHTKDKGYFVFDVNMEEGYRSRWGGHWRGVLADAIYDLDAIYDNETRIGRNRIRIVTTDSAPNRQWEIHERCYSYEQLRETLTSTGFSVRAACDGAQDLGLPDERGRCFVVCQKLAEQSTLGTSPTARQVPWVKFESRLNETTQTAPTPPIKCRPIESCIDDGVYPGETARKSLGEEGENSLRLKAVGEVLRRLAPKPYASLTRQAGHFSWFIPAVAVLGQVHPFPANADASRASTSTAGQPTSAQVVYLSPILENHGWATVVTAVAHELFHVILEHDIHHPAADTYGRQEHEVRQALVRWGFGNELADAESALFRWQEAAPA